jgi:hypothetical protein
MQKTTLFKAAVLVHFLISLFGAFSAFPALLGGPETPGITQGVPQIVIVAGSLLGVMGIVSAYGAWHRQKWGIWLTIVLEAANGLLALPGVLFAPNNTARFLAIFGVAAALFVIVGMLLWSSPPTNRQSNG